jgi:hypothetical protein
VDANALKKRAGAILGEFNGSTTGEAFLAALKKQTADDFVLVVNGVVSVDPQGVKSPQGGIPPASLSAPSNVISASGSINEISLIAAALR